MEREEQIRLARQLLESGVLSEESANAIKADFTELAESEDEMTRKFLKDYAIEMIAGLESDISISVYDGIKGHDPEAEAELEKWKCAMAWLEKQKPAEWSEEDERIRQSLIMDLGNAETDDADVQKELDEQVAWLKSIRPQPHWKPSEEQMASLAWWRRYSGNLESLYNELSEL